MKVFVGRCRGLANSLYARPGKCFLFTKFRPDVPSSGCRGGWHPTFYTLGNSKGNLLNWSHISFLFFALAGLLSLLRENLNPLHSWILVFSLAGIMTEEPKSRNSLIIPAIHIINMIDITITTNNCSEKTVNPNGWICAGWQALWTIIVAAKLPQPLSLLPASH